VNWACFAFIEQVKFEEIHTVVLPSSIHVITTDHFGGFDMAKFNVTQSVTYHHAPKLTDFIALFNLRLVLAYCFVRSMTWFGPVFNAI